MSPKPVSTADGCSPPSLARKEAVHFKSASRVATLRGPTSVFITLTMSPLIERQRERESHRKRERDRDRERQRPGKTDRGTGKQTERGREWCL